MKEVNKISSKWPDYELLDSGEGRKLERFGIRLLDRPDPQAIWKKTNEDNWKLVDFKFIWDKKDERWQNLKSLPENWLINWQNQKMELSLNNFKHVGIFPEHSNQWKEIQKIGFENKGIKLLNLFGYSGGLSLAAVNAGIKVTHVDSSKQILSVLKQNIRHSNLKDDCMRIICEDALKYSKRLLERGEQFEIIVMDPPAFGRGPKGEIWKIEESLPSLIEIVSKLFSSDAKLFILNGYAAGFSPQTFAEIIKDYFLKEENISFGSISILQNDKKRILTTGIYSQYLF